MLFSPKCRFYYSAHSLIKFSLKHILRVAHKRLCLVEVKIIPKVGSYRSVVADELRFSLDFDFQHLLRPSRVNILTRNSLNQHSNFPRFKISCKMRLLWTADANRDQFNVVDSFTFLGEKFLIANSTNLMELKHDILRLKRFSKI